MSCPHKPPCALSRSTRTGQVLHECEVRSFDHGYATGLQDAVNKLRQQAALGGDGASLLFAVARRLEKR